MPAAEVVGKWKSQSDFQGGLGRRLFHNLILPPGPTQEAYASLAGFQVITHGRIGVITEDLGSLIFTFSTSMFATGSTTRVENIWPRNIPFLLLTNLSAS